MKRQATGFGEEVATVPAVRSPYAVNTTARSGFLRLGLLVLVVAGLSWASRELNLTSYLNREGMRALVEAHEPYGPLVFMGVCIAGVWVHMPGILLIWIGGLVFGAVRGFAYGWSACVVGATFNFLLVRHLARDHFQRHLTDRVARLRAFDERLGRNGFRTVLVMRLALFMAPPLNWGLGLTRVSFLQYVAGTAVGLIPGTAITTYFAETSTAPDAELLSAKVIVATFGLVAFLAMTTIAGRRLLAGRSAAPPPPA